MTIANLSKAIVRRIFITYVIWREKEHTLHQRLYSISTFKLQKIQQDMFYMFLKGQCNIKCTVWCFIMWDDAFSRPQQCSANMFNIFCDPPLKGVCHKIFDLHDSNPSSFFEFGFNFAKIFDHKARKWNRRVKILGLVNPFLYFKYFLSC